MAERIGRLKNIPPGASFDTPTDEGVTHTSTGTIRQRGNKEERDALYVSPELMKEAGIDPDTHVPYWARDPRQWAKREMKDRVEELSNDYDSVLGGMSAEVCRTKDSDFIERGVDLVLMKIPRYVKEEEQAVIDEGSQAYQQEFRYAQGEGYVADEDLFDRSELKRRMREEHEYNRRTGFGMGNSPTMGLSYQEAQWVMRNRQEEVAARQTELRQGGDFTPMGLEQFQQMMVGSRTSAKAAELREAGKGKSVSMSGSGFQRNPNSPLAQAQAKERRA